MVHNAEIHDGTLLSGRTEWFAIKTKNSLLCTSIVSSFSASILNALLHTTQLSKSAMSFRDKKVSNETVREFGRKCQVIHCRVWGGK